MDAAKGYENLLHQGGKMMMTLAGAMSTAELGKSLAEMIRQDKVHIISCTGANLEEDIYNLVAHEHYKRVPNYREFSPADEQQLLDEKYNRVTDTCIPEEEALNRIERHMLSIWQGAQADEKAYLPHEYVYQLIDTGELNQYYEDGSDSWLLAAREKNLPIVVPGWEDSTLGNNFAAYCMRGELDPRIMKSGIHYMMELARWYERQSAPIGFFQIGGGIAGDFPICVVPMLKHEPQKKETPLWAYYCQISDSTTSYGSYSGAVPNEKISWEKLHTETPKFVIESDATIVAPLIFAWILGR